MQNQTKAHLTDRNIWTRGIYTLIFVVAYAVAEALLTLVAVFQFLMALLTGRVNEALQQFGANLTQYAYQIFQYVTFNSEEQPFPFSDWPDVPMGTTPWSVEKESVEKESVEKESDEKETPAAPAAADQEPEAPDAPNPPRPTSG